LLLAALFIPLAAAQIHAPSGQRKYIISGTVVDSVHGGVLPEIEVSIREAESDSLLRAVVTGDDGRFEFRDLPRGKYGLNAHGRGFAAQSFQEHGGFSTAIVTGEGLQSQALVFSLKPEASISGASPTTTTNLCRKRKSCCSSPACREAPKPYSSVARS